MRKLLYIALLFLMVTPAVAQYFPVYSQYLYNKLILNPAYAGADGVLSADLFHRNQWMGINGAPVYQTFVAHIPLERQNAGIGVSFLNEKRGIFRQNQFYLNYSYRIVQGNQHLHFGIRGGLHYMNANWNNIVTTDPGDATFTEATPSSLLPNFGVGVYYYTNLYFIGASIPYLMSYVPAVNNNGYSLRNDFSSYTYLVNFGVNARFKNFRLTPSMLLKYHTLIGDQIDFNLMAYLFNERLGIGNSFRLRDAYCLLVDFQINTQLRTGIAYDFPVAKLSRYSNGSFEVVLRYIFKYQIETPDPRYL